MNFLKILYILFMIAAILLVLKVAVSWWRESQGGGDGGSRTAVPASPNPGGGWNPAYVRNMALLN